MVQATGPTEGGFRLHGVTANITRQRAAGAERERMLERALSEQARLKGIIAHLPKGLVLVEADTGRVVACNQQAEGLLEAGEHLPLHRVLARGEVVLNERVSYLRTTGARPAFRQRRPRSVRAGGRQR